MPDTPLLYRWKDAVKSPDGPPDPVLRLVCLVLAGWWKDTRRPAASPSLSVLSDQVGIGERALRDRLRQLAGTWIDVETRAGRRSVYRPILPSAGADVPTLSDVREGSEPSLSYPQPRHDRSGVWPWSTPAPPFRGPRHGRSGVPGTVVPGSVVPTVDLQGTQGAGAREVGDEPPAAAPGADDDQLPIAGVGFHLAELLPEDAREDYLSWKRRQDPGDDPPPPQEAASHG